VWGVRHRRHLKNSASRVFRFCSEFEEFCQRGGLAEIVVRKNHSDAFGLRFLAQFPERFRRAQFHIDKARVLQEPPEQRTPLRHAQVPRAALHRMSHRYNQGCLEPGKAFFQCGACRGIGESIYAHLQKIHGIRAQPESRGQRFWVVDCSDNSATKNRNGYFREKHGRLVRKITDTVPRA